MDTFKKLSDEENKRLVVSRYKYRHKKLKEYVELSGGILIDIPEFD